MRLTTLRSRFLVTCPRVGLLGLNVAWLITTGMALNAIRLRRIEQHREWMLRSHTVTFAFVTYRMVSSWLRHWIDVPDDPVADNIARCDYLPARTRSVGLHASLLDGLRRIIR